MSDWNTPGAASTAQIKCNGSTFSTNGATGSALVRRIKDVARSCGINKFDIYDASGRSVTQNDVETSSFEGDLIVTRFNVAA